MKIKMRFNLIKITTIILGTEISAVVSCLNASVTLVIGAILK